MKVPTLFISIFEHIGINYELTAVIKKEDVEEFTGTNILQSHAHVTVAKRAKYYLNLSKAQFDKFSKYLRKTYADTVGIAKYKDSDGFEYDIICANYYGTSLPAVSTNLSHSLSTLIKNNHHNKFTLTFFKDDKTADVYMPIGANNHTGDTTRFNTNYLYGKIREQNAQIILPSIFSLTIEPKDLYKSEEFFYIILKYLETKVTDKQPILRSTKILNRKNLINKLRKLQAQQREDYKTYRRINFDKIKDMLDHPFAMSASYEDGQYAITLKKYYMYFERRWYDLGKLTILFDSDGFFKLVKNSEKEMDYPHPHVTSSNACTDGFGSIIESSKGNQLMHIYTIIQYLKNYNPASTYRALENGFTVANWCDVHKDFEAGTCFLSELGDNVYQKFVDGKVTEV